MPFCSKCGTQVPEDVSFCSKCGNKLQGEQSSTPTPPITPKVEVSTQSDETKPTLYNPIAIACWGIISPPFGFIMFYLNFKTLNNYKTTLYNLSPIEKEKLSSSGLGSFAEEENAKSKSLGQLKCIYMGVGAIFFYPLCIFLFDLIKDLKKDMMDIYGSEEYNKKPLLIPVVIMMIIMVAIIASVVGFIEPF